MSGFWEDLYGNKAFWAIMLSSLTAQSIKIVLGVLKEKKFNFYWLLGTGGMPSAHSAAVVSLVFCVGKELGSASPLFALSLLFALINMFDAQTWRRSIGTQAKILNGMMADLHSKKKIEDKKLRELAGHTPIEVFMGSIVGAVVTLIVYNLT
ncbi:MAG: divergent PAP2 family protein [Candidatus Omnitrophota bacterium]